MTRPLVVLAIVLASAFCSCKSTPAWLSLPGATQTQGVKVAVDGVLKGATMISAVTGEALNVSGADISRCTISFEAYDLHGSLLATARAVRQDFESGESWRFKAEFARYVEDARTISSARVTVIP